MLSILVSVGLAELSCVTLSMPSICPVEYVSFCTTFLVSEQAHNVNNNEQIVIKIMILKKWAMILSYIAYNNIFKKYILKAMQI